MQLKTVQKSAVYLLLALLAGSVTWNGRLTSVFGQSWAPGGFLENGSTPATRPRLTVSQIQAFLPATRDAFTFPAPYGTQAYRITLPTDCGGQDCVDSVGYSYWRNMNNHAGSNTMYVFLGLDRTKGGPGPTLFSIDKTTGLVTKVGPLFDPSDDWSWASGEGWYFSATLPTILYLRGVTALLRYDVLSHVTTTVFDIATRPDLFGSNTVIWQNHSSNDDQAHSFTVRLNDDSTDPPLGCGVYLGASDQFQFYPRISSNSDDYDECQIDKSGRWLVIKEQVDGLNGPDNRIIDLQTNTETVLLDENGAGGHSDTGFGYMVAADNWFATPVLRLWQYGTSPLGPGTPVYKDQNWASQSLQHVSHLNAVPGPIGPQYACGSGAARLDGPRFNEITCFLLDGSLTTLIVAPVMTDMDAPGGVDDYNKLPKGNVDVTGQYFIWTTNLGSDRQDAIIVRVPSPLLTEPNVAPTVSLTSPTTWAAFPTQSTIVLTATASDTQGVPSVSFYRNGNLIGTDTTPPYSVTWANVPKGTYTLTAVATDVHNATTTSAPVPISVGNPVGSPAPTSLAFAKQLVGTQSATKVVTFTNTGFAKLVFSSFNGVAPTTNFQAGPFPGSTTCSVNNQGVAAGASCTFTFRYSPTAAGASNVNFSMADNASNTPQTIALSGTGFAVDAPTVVQMVTTGGSRLQGLQNPDGGWSYKVGTTGCFGPPSCPNTIGITGLGLLASYVRTSNASLLTGATAAGNALVSQYNAAILTTPPGLPHNQDVEFLVGLAELTGNALYATTAQGWFQKEKDQYPDAATRIDAFITARNAMHLRSLAAWDAAAFIRAAKAVGMMDYAVAAASRIRSREADWKDTTLSHRFDKCPNPSGCGPADNPVAFDHTLLGEGSLLWAVHDLPGFDAQVSEYRSYLVGQQDPEGSWDVGDSQITSYIVMGLAAVGGTGADAAMRAAAAFFIRNQLPAGGMPGYVTSTTVGAEYMEVDAEVVRAMATLFSTPAGANVSVVPAQLSSITFSNVTAPGVTSVIAIDQSKVTTVQGGFGIVNGLTYEVTTTASISGSITVCFSVPTITDPTVFAAVRIMHGEAGVLVDRTILTGPLAPDFTTKRVCALVSSLSPFAIALQDPPAPPPVNHAPVCALATPTVGILWPADHRLVTVSVQGVTDPDGDALEIAVTSVFQDEPTNNENVTATSIDAFLLAPNQVQLRAERGTPKPPPSNGRVYHVRFSASDGLGGMCDGEVTVAAPAALTVAAIDDGPLYDSTIAVRK